MDTFDNVHVFSNTTAEISQEYIDKFHEPNAVPNYLQELSQKSGVELLSRGGTYAVKGSWLSVNRAHSFLGKFLLTYGQTIIDAVSLVEEKNFSKDEETSDFTHFNSPRKKWKKASAEENVTNVDQALPVEKVLPPRPAKVTPEPVVLYAGYQTNAKEVESRRKTLEVLKNVYKQDQNNQVTSTPTKEDNNDARGPSDSKTLESEYDDQKADSSSQSLSEEHDKIELTKLKSETESVDSGMLMGTRRIPPKVLSKEETAAKRKKVEAIAENILSNVPSKEVVSISSSDTDKVDDRPTGVDEDATGMELNVNQSYLQTDTDQKVKSKSLDDEDDIDEPDDYDNDDSDPTKDDDSVSDFKDDSNDKDYSGDTEVESGDDEKGEKLETSDTEYVPEEKVSVSKVVSASKRTTRRSKATQKLEELADFPKKGRGRSRKGFPVKLDIKLPTKSTNDTSPKAQNKQSVGGQRKRRGRPKKTTPDAPKEYHCDKCPYYANKRCHLREHERRVHITKEFKCQHCDKIFGFGKDLKRHLKTHMKPQNCCDICGKMYKGMKSLVEHRKSHDDGYVKPEFECEICSKVFSTKYVLAYHIKSEHLGMKRTFMCPTCGKSFSQKNSYIQHANVHMGFKPYKCEICDKAFSYEKSLKEHRFMHDDIRRFKCHVCDKSFRQSSAMTIHMKVHKETKDYVCMACGRGFSQKQALIRHERIHLGEKPFSCGLCGRNFTDSSILRRHMILIHKKDPKRWQEDTINNTVRRTDFFIDVLPEVTEESSERPSPVKIPTVQAQPPVVNASFTTAAKPATVSNNIVPQVEDRERSGEVELQERSGVSDVPEMHPDEMEVQNYHVAVGHMQVETMQSLTSDIEGSVSLADQKIMSVSGHPEPVITQSSTQQSLVENKADGEYISAGIPGHMSYAVMGQSGYNYSQMVMVPDPNIPFASSTSPVYQPQYSDPSSHQFSGYPPPQA